MQALPNLILIGPMGAGKSTIGRRLAKRLGLRFVDTDQALERRTGVDIPTIFDIEGESGFREREATMIDTLTREDDIVLSTGGGAVVRPENRDRLGAAGVVIYLQADVATQAKRTERGNRPMLGDGDRHQRLELLYEQRDPLYREIADFIIDTSGGSIDAVVNDIVRHLEGNADEH